MRPTTHPHHTAATATDYLTGALDAVTASWTIVREEDGYLLYPNCGLNGLSNQWHNRFGTARARRAGLEEAEPGAGSAGPGAAQRRRLF